MLTILFFGQLADILKCRSLSMPSQRITTLEDLLSILQDRDPKWADAFSDDKLMMAVNQTLVQAKHPVRAGDEVAFFPPVTGG
jgi:sulfur-carrier protein